MFYENCEYCPVLGDRVKTLPFGNKDGTIVVVVPNFSRLNEEQRLNLELAHPEAYFVGFPACANVEDVEAAELVCGILLRNETRQYRRFLVYDSEALRDLFHIGSDATVRDDGVKFNTFKGRIGDASFKEEYNRLKNDD